MRVDAGCRWLGAVVALLLLLLLLVGPVRAQSSGKLPEPVGRSIQALLAQKARRTPAQRKLSSQLLDAAESAQAAGSDARRQARDADAKDEIVTVDIRADVTPAVLARIRALGGTVINSVPKYRAIRAELPVAAIERLAALAAVQTIRPADEAITRKVNTTQGDAAHRATVARTTYSVDGTGIGIGVISDGVRTLADRQASGDVPAQVTVLPGQAGAGDEGTALLEIVYDLAPGADLYFATGFGGQARMAVNIEALCEAGANVIVDDVGYFYEAAFQDDIVAQGVNAAVADGCVFFSAGGNDGNLTHRTSGVWEGDYAAGSALVVDGQRVGTKHDFGGGVEANELEGRSVRTIILQWADPLGDSSNDYDLFLVNENGAVLASSTDTQDGTQDPIESISSPIFTYSGLSVVVVKASGANRYLRVQAHSGPLAVATAGTLYGHSAQENAISVAMVDVATAGGTGGVFDGTESVHRDNSDGPRRIFFEADGTAITSGNFSATGGKLLQKPDLTAATCVTTATPGFSRFCGTSAAAPHAAAIGALMLEAAGGPEQVTLAQLRTAMTGAALDIEATGVDRDSGYGIVMSPAAVDAVDVAVADRNAAPTVTSSQSDRTFAAGAAAPPINLATVFSDPDATDTLTYEAVSSDPDRLAVTRSDAMVTLTPGSPGRAVVTLRAIDPDGLSAVETFSVLVTAGNRDYDADNDGLIDVGNLAQLDAVRYDLNGDGLVDGATWMPYYAAFPMGALGMGCPTADGCTGYELTADLDFDTNGDGRADVVGDTYWNAGAGWEPIGEADDPFTADFAGDGHTIANLFIDRDTEDGVGLFGASNRSAMRGVGLTGVDVTGDDGVGSLLGHGVYATVVDSSATGRVSGQDEVGGLVGRTRGRVRRSWTAVNVSGADAVGGLVGHQLLNNLDSSYATGDVEGMNAVGGLVGAVSDTSQVILASYATGDVSGRGARLSESDSGFIICDLIGGFTTSGPVETTTSSGGGVGGLVGSSCGVIEASYATGWVSGDAAVGGLVGSGQYIRVRAGYWDLETSGVRVGVGEDDANDNGVIDGTESQRLGVGGRFVQFGSVPEPGRELQIEAAMHSLAAVREHPDFEVVECRLLEDGNAASEVIVVDCRCDGVPTQNPVGIQYRERLGLQFFAAENRPPEVRALREDFLCTAHQNYVGRDEPVSLCLYFESWPAVHRTWTPQKHLARIQWWLAETANGTLHRDDQPVEPIYFSSRFALVLPENFESQAEETDQVLVVEPRRSPGRRKDSPILVGRMVSAAEAEKITNVSIQCVALTIPPIVHGPMERIPVCLGALHDQMESRGAPIVQKLKAQIQQQTDEAGVTASENTCVLLVLKIPITRTAGGEAERVESKGFIVNAPLAKLGVACGALTQHEGKYYRNVLIGTETAGEQTDWRDIAVEPLEILQPFTAQLAQRMSGLTSPGPRGVLTGVGALGSCMATIWQREAWGHWSFIDPDFLKPHNLVRHTGLEPQVGWPKVDVARCLGASLLCSESSQEVDIFAGAADFGNPEVCDALESAELVVDATTTLEVPRELAGRDALKRMASVFVTLSGLDSVLMIEDARREIRIDCLEPQYYRAIVNEPWGESHLLEKSGVRRVGAGCRDLSVVISHELITLHGATLARHIRLAFESEQPSVKVWRCDAESGGLSVEVVVLHQVLSERLNGLRIVWDEGVRQRVRQLRTENLPNETGGVLLGYFDLPNASVYLVDVLPAPADSQGDPSGFTRGIDGLSADVKRVSERTGGIVDYVGEWHSHPPGSSARPSTADMDQMASLACALHRDGLPAVMLIAGEDEERWMAGEVGE